jgi:pimeloyl-ACP methyl ester carboxylesterase
MTTGVSVTHQESDMSAAFTTGSVIARDGVTIGYRQIGRGPGLVVLHGAMESSASHTQLAAALADMLTIYLPDRRGRGMSGAHGSGYSVQEEIGDLEALMTHTGARYVFGVSAGALIALHAALTLPAISKLALFEPPIFPTTTEPEAILSRYDREMARGKISAALVTAMKGAQMGPPIFNFMPSWLLERLTASAMASEDNKPVGDSLPMRTLAPTLHYDFALVAQLSGSVEPFKAPSTETLLLSGSKSPAYLRASVDRLEGILPHAQRVDFPGLNHGASGNTDRFGQPDVVARALRGFFA